MAQLDLFLDGASQERPTLRAELYNVADVFQEVQDSVNTLYTEGVGGGSLGDLATLDQVGTNQIENAAVTSEKLGDGEVTLQKLALGTADRYYITDGSGATVLAEIPTPGSGSIAQGTVDGQAGNVSEVTAVVLGTTDDQIVLFDQAIAIANNLADEVTFGLLNTHATTDQTVTITSETPVAVSDAVWGTPSAEAVTITSAGSNLPVLAAGESFVVADHSNSVNNGLYIATGTPTASSLPSSKIAGSNPAAAASEAVTVAETRVFETGLNTCDIPPNGLRRFWMEGTLIRTRGDDIVIDFSGRDLTNAPNVVLTTTFPTELDDATVSVQANNTLTVSPIFWAGTQANYDALTPNADTLYFILAV